jgi:hypothetical protein
MSTAVSPLDNIRVASPCRASWEAMTGDDKARFCQSCHKNVFNISLMTREEAETLIREKEGNLCVRFARRADGTIVTGDCPVGRRVRKTKRGAFVMALLAVLIPSPLATFMKRASASALRVVPAMATLEETPTGHKVFAWLAPEDSGGGMMEMGEIAPMPNPAPPNSGK